MVLSGLWNGLVVSSLGLDNIDGVRGHVYATDPPSEEMVMLGEGDERKVSVFLLNTSPRQR